MMMRPWAAVAVMTAAAAVGAQDAGDWRPSSTTAKQVTGELMLGGSRLTMNFSTFPVAQIRALTAEEIAAVGEDGGSGFVYKVGIRSDKTFLHKNRLCGDQDTQWMVTVASGKQLEVLFFSNTAAPTLTVDGLANSADLCGTFRYER